MTRKELEQRLNKLLDNKFYLAMKDHWNAEDYRRDCEYDREIAKIRKKLENN